MIGNQETISGGCQHSLIGFEIRLSLAKTVFSLGSDIGEIDKCKYPKRKKLPVGQAINGLQRLPSQSLLSFDRFGELHLDFEQGDLISDC